MPDETLRPAAVAALEPVFGGPSEAGFGSAVFWEPRDEDGLEGVGRRVYERFVGRNWERFGADTWMATFARVHRRDPDGARDVVAELGAIEDAGARRAVRVFLDGLEDPAAGAAALHAAFDADDVSELEVYRIGDGEALSGLLLVGAATAPEGVCVVAFLMD